MRLQKGILYALMAVAMAACNSQSEIDSNFLSNLNPTSSPVPTPAPFSSNFSFATANSSQYNFDPTKIDFSNGYAELTSSSQTDNSNVAAGFAGGSSTGTTFSTATDGNSNSNYVMLSQSGTPTNNSELDESWSPAWSNISGVWHLNGTLGAIASGTAIVDSSGNGASGSVAAAGANYVTGRFKQGILFDGNEMISIPANVAPNPCSSITVAFWMNSTSTGYFDSPLAKTGQSSASPGYQVTRLSNGNNLYLRIDTSAQANQFIGWNSADNFFDGNWHHVAFTFNAGSAAVYKDGILESTGTYVQGDGFCNSTQPLNLGGSINNPYGNTAGTYDELAVWNTALSAASISAIYQRQSAKYAGTFTSRVMDGLSTSANWTNFSWIPTLPFFKELPDSGTSESQANYSSLIDSTTTPGTTKNLMDGIVGLWHLDEAAGTSVAGSVLDQSGKGNNGTPQGGITFGVNGALGTAATFDGSTSFISVPSSVSLNPTTYLSVSAWIKTSSTGEQYIAEKTEDSFFLATGLTANKACFFINSISAAWLCSVTSISDGQWHHVAGTYDGSVLSMYVDGSLSASINRTGAIPSAGIADLNIGFRPGYTYFDGAIDEVAIWSRALSSAEVLELYRRGANRIKYQVRTCTAADCSDDATNANWKGPDNSNQSYFSELNNNAIQSDGGDVTGSDSVQAGLPTMTFANFSGLTVPNHRYFQYRAIMESDDTSTNCTYDGGATHTWCSPELKVVSAGPGHFDTTAPTITNKTGVSYDTLTTLVETIDSNGCGSGTLYNISPDNVTWYYWTGAAWGLSDGTVSKANPATTITSNLSTFATQAGTGTVYFKVFLQSSGTSTCAIDSLSISGTH